MIALDPQNINLLPFPLRSLPTLLNGVDGRLLNLRSNTQILLAEEPRYREIFVAVVSEDVSKGSAALVAKGQ